MRFEIIGPTAMYVGSQRVPLGPAKQRGMLALLLLHVGEPVRAATIVDHLWEGDDLNSCKAKLYALVSRIRAALRTAGLEESLHRLASHAAYRLDVDPGLVDYHRFRRIVTLARYSASQAEYEQAAIQLNDALTLWKDEPLADLRGSTADSVRLHMAHEYLEAHKILAGSWLRLGRHDPVLVNLEQLTRDHPLDEGLAQLKMQALYAAGRIDEARAFAATFRIRYRNGFGQEPNLQFETLRVSAGLENPTAQTGLDTSRAVPTPHIQTPHIQTPHIQTPHIQTPHTRTPHTQIPPALILPVLIAPHQLPPDIGDFSGHRDLIAALDELTDPEHDGARLAVISGMPGVGKTTLVVHWGHRNRDLFPDGQLYLDASACGPAPPVNPAEVLGRFLMAFGVPADRVAPTAEQRRDHLNRILVGRRVLLVLDNVRDADQVRPMLPASNTCVCLITSRRRLASLSIREGARHLTVEPLPGSECRSMLNRMVGTGRADAEPRALQALIQLSGGLPLALRIIGEHVAERPRARIADLADQLSRHLLDEHSDGDASVRTVFAWSYHLLDPDAARLFRTIGLHPAPSINPAAAAAMAGLELSHTRTLLDGLARGHLINHDAVGRYRFHELLRVYAGDRGRQHEDPATTEASLRRLLDWYLLSAANAAAVLTPRRAPVPDLPQQIEPGNGELEKGGAVKSGAVKSEIGRVAPETFARTEMEGRATGPHSPDPAPEVKAMAWCEAERANLVTLGLWAMEHFPRHCWQIAAAIHEVFERYGRQDDMHELHRSALIAARKDGHEVGQTITLCNLGATYVIRRDYGRAAASFRAGAELSRSIGLVEGDAACSHNLASVHLRTGDNTRAIDMYTHVLAVFTERVDLAGQASALCGLAQANHRLGNTDQSVTYYHDALSRSAAAGAIRIQAAAHSELAALYLTIGKHHLAAVHGQQALDLHPHARDETIRCSTLATMADIHRELGQYESAVQICTEALAISETLADSYQRCRILTVRADTLAALGDFPAAGAAKAEATNIIAQLSDHDREVQLLRDRLAGG